MKVWFHTTREQYYDDGEGYDYDSFTDSKLFSSMELCSVDAEKEEKEELQRMAERYKESYDRWSGRNQAILMLREMGIDAHKLWFNVAEEAPKFQKPSERFIYFLEVEE